MLHANVKVSKQIKYSKYLNEFIIKRYQPGALDDKVIKFISELEQNQNVLANIGQVALNLTTLQQNRDILIKYILQVFQLTSKIPCADPNFSPKITFSFTDVLKHSNWKSNNLYFEYYNSIFNLATCYFHIATLMEKEPNDNENWFKEINKNYKSATGLFNLLKDEIPQKIPKNEIPIDLSPEYCEYCSICSMAESQRIVLKISEKLGKNFELQAKLAAGVSKLCKDAYQCAEVPCVNKFLESTKKDYLFNRCLFYNVLYFIKLRDSAKYNFETNGRGFGDLIGYQKIVILKMEQCLPSMKKMGKILNAVEFENNIAKEKLYLEEIEGKNFRIYHETVNEKNGEKVEEKIMSNGNIPPELFIGENYSPEKYDNILDSLIPNEVLTMISKYKDKMMEEVNQKLFENQNEQKVNEFLSQLPIPEKFSNPDKIAYNAEIDDELWEKIQGVQAKGGSMGIMDTIQGILNNSEEMDRKLKEALQNLAREAQEDNYYRNKVGEDRWIRDPSNKINGHLVGSCQKYISNLGKSRPYDLKEKTDIIDNMRYFEQLGAPKEVINQHIPGNKNKSDKVKFSKNEENLKTAMKEVQELALKIEEIIKNIFTMLNEDSRMGKLFLEVINKKTTEIAIFEEQKVKFEEKLCKLIPLTQQIESKKESINEILKKCQEEWEEEKKSKYISEDAKRFIQNLNTYVNMYNKKYEVLQKGKSYYSNVMNQIEELLKGIESFLKRREEEKNYLIQTITGRTPQAKQQQGPIATNGNYGDSQAFLDPSQNLITNMNVTSIYQFTGGHSNTHQQNKRGNQNQRMGGNMGYNQQQQHQYNPNMGGNMRNMMPPQNPQMFNPNMGNNQGQNPLMFNPNMGNTGISQYPN